MKKIGLACATLLVGLSLAGCNNMASQSHKSSSNSSSVKVVKHHKTNKKVVKKNKKKQSYASTASQSSRQSNSQQYQSAQRQSNQTQGQTTQQSQANNNSHDTNPASSKNYDPSELQKNAQASIGSDGLMHGRVYGSNGYWIDVDASRQGLADEGMPNSDQDIMNHAETGNAMWNAGQNAGQ